VEAAAALLLDAVEDGGGKPMLTKIRNRCNENVADIVEGCSDSLVDTTQGAGKEPWLKRKERYLAELGAHGPPILLVSACDKLHNLRATRVDLRGARRHALGQVQPGIGVAWAALVLHRALEHLPGGRRGRVRRVAKLMGVELAGLRALLSAHGHDPSDFGQRLNRPG
jgi:hypothetical protein